MNGIIAPKHWLAFGITMGTMILHPEANGARLVGLGSAASFRSFEDWL